MLLKICRNVYPGLVPINIHTHTPCEKADKRRMTVIIHSRVIPLPLNLHENSNPFITFASFEDLLILRSYIPADLQLGAAKTSSLGIG